MTDMSLEDLTNDTPPALRIIWHGRVTLVNARHNRHWSTNAAENTQLRTWASITARRHPPIDPCTIEFLAIWPKGRLPDCDAVALAAKPIIDGLVDAGIIPDDAPEHVRSITYHAPQREAGPDGYDGFALICVVKPAAPTSDVSDGRSTTHAEHGDAV